MKFMVKVICFHVNSTSNANIWLNSKLALLNLIYYVFICINFMYLCITEHVLYVHISHTSYCILLYTTLSTLFLKKNPY